MVSGASLAKPPCFTSPTTPTMEHQPVPENPGSILCPTADRPGQKRRAETSAHDDDRFRTIGVTLVKLPPVRQPDAQCTKVIPADDQLAGGDSLGGLALTGHGEIPLYASVAEGQAVPDCAHGVGSRKRADPFQHGIMESHPLDVCAVPGLRQLQIQDDDIFRDNAGVHIQETHETLDEQTGAHLQDEC